MGEFRDGWKVVLAAACGVGVGLIGAPIFTLGTFLVPLSKTFGWTRAEVSAASLFLVFGTIVTAPFVGRFADRIGVRSIGIVSVALLAVAQVGMTQIGPSVMSFYLALIVFSLMGCGTSPIVWTRGVASWFDAKRGLAFGLTLAGTGVAAMVLPPFVGGLIAADGWQAGYLGLAAITAVAIVPVALFFRERGRTERGLAAAPVAHPGYTLKEALRMRRFWQLGLGNVLVTGSTAALVVHFVALLQDSGMTPAMAVRTAGLIGAAIVVGRLSTGYLVDKFHPPAVGAAFMLIPCAGALLLATSAPSAAVAGVAALAFGLAAGAEVDLVAYMTTRYFGLKAYGEIYGWQFILFELAVGFGPLLMGRMYDLNGNYEAGLLVLAAAYVIASLSFGSLGKAPDFAQSETAPVV
jgi:MFS family permease